MLARPCGKADVHYLELEDLAALTIEATAMPPCRWAGRTGSRMRHELD
jgi:hypothetical protein